MLYAVIASFISFRVIKLQLKFKKTFFRVFIIRYHVILHPSSIIVSLFVNINHFYCFICFYDILNSSIKCPSICSSFMVSQKFIMIQYIQYSHCIKRENSSRNVCFCFFHHFISSFSFITVITFWVSNSESQKSTKICWILTTFFKWCKATINCFGRMRPKLSLFLFHLNLIFMISWLTFNQTWCIYFSWWFMFLFLHVPVSL